jgi:hypothetical protein
MVGFILACTGHRYRAVAGSNPALPTNSKFYFLLGTANLFTYQTVILFKIMNIRVKKMSSSKKLIGHLTDAGKE